MLGILITIVNEIEEDIEWTDPVSVFEQLFQLRKGVFLLI